MTQLETTARGRTPYPSGLRAILDTSAERQIVVSRAVYLPAQYAVKGRVGRNRIEQLRVPEGVREVELGSYIVRRQSLPLLRPVGGGPATVLASSKLTIPDSVPEVLFIPGESGDVIARLAPGARARWVRPQPSLPDTRTRDEAVEYCASIRASWRDRFSFRAEQEVGGERRPGLRSPQIGALHRVLAHWTVTDEPAMIVMPTGTGKTETMLALLTCERLERLLVLVPTVALRDQISDKFLTLGILKRVGVLDRDALWPVVGTLEHRLRTVGEVDEYFTRCNVVVSTVQVLAGCGDDVRRRIAELCSHLFIDEAHHVPAPSWSAVRHAFLHRRIVQFTATPFRGDGKHIEGKVIYQYPLRKAQSEGYFTQIAFRAVSAYDEDASDQRVAETAIEQLRTDLTEGYDHIVMARTAGIERAKSVHRLYSELAPQHHPVVIHNRVSAGERQEVLRRLRSRESRIVVCVDMLGEGFDLPELKIAALHDMHRGLAITLQFIGRFTRTSNTIGRATAIANIADARVEESLRELYAQNADWNAILQRLSEAATGREVRRSEFLSGFTEIPQDIPLQNVLPKMSTVVYRTQGGRWRPERIPEAVGEDVLYAGPSVNEREQVLMFVTRTFEPVAWCDLKSIYNTIWDLYLMHWDAERRLLFINSSNSDYHEALARAVAGPEAEPVRGETVFRILHGIKWPILMNLGLSHAVNRAVRFTMHIGADIRAGLADPQLRNKRKANVFARGYEDGGRATAGCSYRGRIWSYRIASDISEWVAWCTKIGDKLLNDRISVDDLFAGAIVPEAVTERPRLVPVAIEWGDGLLQRSEEVVQLEFGGTQTPLLEVGIELTTIAPDGPLRFRVFSENGAADYEVRFSAQGVDYVPLGRHRARIWVGRRWRPLEDWLRNEDGPVIRFADGSFLVYAELFRPTLRPGAFSTDRIRVLDWTGTDLSRESQTAGKEATSVQFRLIRELERPDRERIYDIIFDDDGPGEAADVVAIQLDGEQIFVDLYHCKFSRVPTPGARVEDLYEVCGQAQKNAFWKGELDKLFRHLRQREVKRIARAANSRFEVGNLAKLRAVEHKALSSKVEVTVWVVQPGLSKTQVSAAQRDLLGVTELFLKEAYGIDFGVIASE